MHKSFTSYPKLLVIAIVNKVSGTDIMVPPERQFSGSTSKHNLNTYEKKDFYWAEIMIE